MKVRLATIFNQEAQTGFYLITKAAMPFKISYAVTKNLKKLQGKLDDIEQVRNDLVKKYGKADDKGVIGVEPGSDKDTAFRKEFGEHLMTEVELDIWKIPVSSLIAANLKLTPGQIEAMDDFLQDDTPSEPSTPEVPVGGAAK